MQGDLIAVVKAEWKASTTTVCQLRTARLTCVVSGLNRSAVGYIDHATAEPTLLGNNCRLGKNMIDWE